jgi:hypothetical protein
MRPAKRRSRTAATTLDGGTAKPVTATGKRRGRARAGASESDHGRALFKWVTLAESTHPDLRLFYHIPNGGSRASKTRTTADGRTVRYSPEAARMKGEGVRAGVLDYNLDVARGGFFGLRLELKTATGKVSADQRQWILAETQAGYAATVCYGWLAARDALLRYLSLPPTERPPSQAQFPDAWA